VADDEPVDEAPTRSARTEKLWADARIDPVEIALPGGVGYTLRAYRPPAELTAGEQDAPELDDFDAASAAVLRRRRATTEDDATDDDTVVDVDDVDEDLDADDDPDADDDADDDDAEDDDADDEDEDEEDEEEDDEDAPANEEVPIFLGRKGRVYLFHSPEKLVEFVKAGAEHDLSQLDTWPELVRKIRTEDVEPLDDDRYELDLVVENLRGGPDAWAPTLILRAGEIARDVGFALRIEPVIVALSAGSPLDDLDEALRKAEDGGVGSFFAKRRLRKIPATQSSLAWRTVIGKISAAADWRD